MTDDKRDAIEIGKILHHAGGADELIAQGYIPDWDLASPTERARRRQEAEAVLDSDWLTQHDKRVAATATADASRNMQRSLPGAMRAMQEAAWNEGVTAAFEGAVTRQNADDVKRSNPYRLPTIPEGSETP